MSDWKNKCASRMNLAPPRKRSGCHYLSLHTSLLLHSQIVFYKYSIAADTWIYELVREIDQSKIVVRNRNIVSFSSLIFWYVTIVRDWLGYRSWFSIVREILKLVPGRSSGNSRYSVWLAMTCKAFIPGSTAIFSVFMNIIYDWLSSYEWRTSSRAFK